MINACRIGGGPPGERRWENPFNQWYPREKLEKLKEIYLKYGLLKVEYVGVRPNDSASDKIYHS